MTLLFPSSEALVPSLQSYPTPPVSRDFAAQGLSIDLSWKQKRDFLSTNVLFN